MYTSIQLEAIKLFGRKDLLEGCRVKLHGEFAIVIEFTGKNLKVWKGNRYLNYKYPEHIGDGLEILGHIPHLEDLFRVAEEEEILYVMIYNSEYENIHCICLWEKGGEGEEILYNPTLPILDQPNLEDILNLFK